MPEGQAGTAGLHQNSFQNRPDLLESSKANRSEGFINRLAPLPPTSLRPDAMMILVHEGFDVLKLAGQKVLPLTSATGCPTEDSALEAQGCRPGGQKVGELLLLECFSTVSLSCLLVLFDI